MQALIFLLIPIGFFVGAYGTLIGVGGGFLLIPFLLIFYPFASSETVTSISLSVIFFNTLSGTFSYARMKRIDFKAGIIFAISSIPGSIAGAWTTSYISRKIFETIFGIFLILSAILLNIINLKNRANNTGNTNNSKKILIGAILSFFVGYLSALLGVGGGIFHVPVLVYLLKFSVHNATATSHFILSVISFFASMTHVVKGSLHANWLKVIFLTAGVIPGAQLGAYLSNKMSETWIMRALTIAILILGIRLILR